MQYIGIDPGTQGALCSLNPGLKTCKFFNTPDSKLLSATLDETFTWLLSTSTATTKAAIEDVHSIFGMSAKSNFQFGRNLAFVETIVHLLFRKDRITYVTPKVWQKGCGIEFTYPEAATPAEKAKIRKLTIAGKALELYPDAQIYGPKGGLKDGRADALMIAHYLSLQ